MPTIIDVARRAGVSIATVSRVLNGGAPVHEATRRRVEQAVAELGFSPNGLARALHSKRTRSVGLLVPDISNPYYPELARGVEDVASQHGYSVVVCNTDGRPDKRREYMRVLREKRVDGVILAGGATEEDQAQPISGESWPAVVGIGYRLPGCVAVGIDNVRAAYEATTHLVQLGHRRVALIAGPLRRLSIRDRVAGYRQSLLEHGIEPDPALIQEGDFRPASGYSAARALLALPEPPTAIFAANDRMAIGAMAAVIDAGLRIPEDVALVGFDDTPLSAYIRPALTTVKVPSYEMGAAAMRQVLALLSKSRDVQPLILLPVRLVVRASSGGPRGGQAPGAPNTVPSTEGT